MAPWYEFPHMITPKIMTSETSSKKLCKQPAMIHRTFDPGVSSLRMGYILSSGLKWVNGTEIKFMFTEGAEPQKNVVRRAFQVWKSLGIGISFKEVASADDAMVRIGFDWRDGSWSYVGRDILTIPRKDHELRLGPDCKQLWDDHCHS
jgi:hypothetical protein